MKIWHYTVGVHLKSILESKQIKPATAYISDNEKPVVWLSSNPNWEETANKAIMKDGEVISLSRIETAKYCGNLFRIEVDSTLLYNWEYFKNKSGIDKKTSKALEDVAYKQGANPNDWWVCFEPISIYDCIDIEILINDKWVSISEYKG